MKQTYTKDNEKKGGEKKCLHDNSRSSVSNPLSSSLNDSLAFLTDSSAASARRPALNPRRNGIAGRELEPKHFDDYIMHERAAREARLSNITQKGAKSW